MPTERPVTLFVFAHPDDEFFCVPFIVDAVRSGHIVRCVYLTDGAWGGQSAARRMSESLRVLARYGVDSAEVYFLGESRSIPDGSLHRHLVAAYQAILPLVRPPLTSIYTMAWEGGHQDHDAAHAMVLQLLREIPTLHAYQFALYNAFGCPRPWFRVMTPMDVNGPVENRALSMREVADMISNGFRYPSQWKTWAALLPFAAWRLITRRCVSRQRLSSCRIRERPHEGSLLYERRDNATYPEVKEYIDIFTSLR